MKNTGWGEGGGGGLIERGGLLAFFVLKGGLTREGGIFERRRGLNRGFMVCKYS